MTLYAESPIRFQARIEGPLGFERVEMALDTGATLVIILHSSHIVWVIAFTNLKTNCP